MTPLPPPASLASLLPSDAPGGRARHPQARDVWMGVVWSRLGRGDRAWAWWDTVDDPALRPWVAAERGRVLRELGLHGEAEELEGPALAGADDPVDRAMLQVSLTADAVGRGEVEAARSRHAVAAASVAGVPDGPRAARQRLRLSWVGVEVAWISGREPTDDGLPRLPQPDAAPTMPADLVHGSAFHRAKALLFGGLVARSLRLLDLAAAEAPPVLAWAVHLARADLDAPGATGAAAMAWQAIVPPAEHADAVRGTPTARRLAATR